MLIVWDDSQRVADTQEFGECTGNDTSTETPMMHDSGMVHKRQRPARDNMSAISIVANNTYNVSVYIQYPRCSHEVNHPVNSELGVEPRAGCEHEHEMDGVHCVYAAPTKRKFTFSVDSGNVSMGQGLSDKLQRRTTRPVIMGRYFSNKSKTGIEHFRTKSSGISVSAIHWQMEDDYSDCTEVLFNAILTKYGMFTSNALVVTASTIPNDFGNTGYFNIDLALNILHIFHTYTSPEWMFASWEINDDMVTHLHLVFEHKRRVDTATRKLQQIPTFTDATISTIKLERTISFPKLFRYYIKNPIMLLSTEQELLDAAFNGLNDN